MPVVTLQTVGKLTPEQKSRIAREFTQTLKSVAGKPEEYTYVIIEEVDPENWAWKGKLFSE